MLRRDVDDLGFTGKLPKSWKGCVRGLQVRAAEVEEASPFVRRRVFPHAMPVKRLPQRQPVKTLGPQTERRRRGKTEPAFFLPRHRCFDQLCRSFPHVLRKPPVVRRETRRVLLEKTVMSPRLPRRRSQRGSGPGIGRREVALIQGKDFHLPFPLLLHAPQKMQIGAGGDRRIKAARFLDRRLAVMDAGDSAAEV